MCKEKKDNFIGETFPTPKGGVLTVVGLNDKKKRSDKVYFCECSICSKDKELFPEPFESLKGNLVTTEKSPSRIPCGCSKSHRYTEQQQTIRIKRLFNATEWVFNGFIGDFKGVNTKCDFYCTSCDKPWNTTELRHILEGIRCPSCGDKIVYEKRKIAEGWLDVGDTFEGVLGNTLTIVKRDSPYFYVTCDKCHTEDPELWCEPIKIIGTNIKRQGTGCSCSDNVNWTSTQMVIRMKRSLLKDSRGYTFEGFNEGYNGNSTKITLNCPEHGEWDSTVARALSMETGCPNCNPSKPTTLEVFLERAKEAHGDKYDYSLVDYKGVNHSVDIICKEHGIFPKTPYVHTAFKCGCPDCDKSAQRYTYIHTLEDNGFPIAIKYGKAKDTDERLREQQSGCCYKLKTVGIWEYENNIQCGSAESEVNKIYRYTSSITKEEMRDGYTETTDVRNIEHIAEIFESYGGIRIL